jgi:CRP/FNR family cyclic AMP-dependent transcriptional regulator
MSAGPMPGPTEKEAGRPVEGVLRSRQLESLERTPLFQALPRRHRGRVADLAELRRYAGGTAIVRTGDPGDSFHVMLEGEALVVTPTGQEHRLSAGDHFGELSLIDGAPRAATVTAAGEVTTGRISRADFQRLLADEPALAVALLPGMALVVRDLLRADAQCIPDHGQVGDWRAGAEEGATEAEGQILEGRDALGWLLMVRHVGAFEALPEEHVRRIARFITVDRYADGSTVTLAGSRGDSLHIILNGHARVRTPSGHTRGLEADDCFGELSLLDGAPRAATVSAIGELTTAKVTRTDFQKLLKSEPGMAVGLLDGLVKTVRDMQQATSTL